MHGLPESPAKVSRTYPRLPVSEYPKYSFCPASSDLDGCVAEPRREHRRLFAEIEFIVFLTMLVLFLLLPQVCLWVVASTLSHSFDYFILQPPAQFCSLQEWVVRSLELVHFLYYIPKEIALSLFDLGTSPLQCLIQRGWHFLDAPSPCLPSAQAALLEGMSSVSKNLAHGECLKKMDWDKISGEVREGMEAGPSKPSSRTGRPHKHVEGYTESVILALIQTFSRYISQDEGAEQLSNVLKIQLAAPQEEAVSDVSKRASQSQGHETALGAYEALQRKGDELASKALSSVSVRKALPTLVICYAGFFGLGLLFTLVRLAVVGLH